MVALLTKPGKTILLELDPKRVSTLHMAVGISGEAGELLDAAKKYSMYAQPIDMENVIEELGDLEFYMEGIRQVLGITREQTLDANIKKLSIRYEGLKYSNEAAKARVDKA